MVRYVEYTLKYKLKVKRDRQVNYKETGEKTRQQTQFMTQKKKMI